MALRPVPRPAHSSVKALPRVVPLSCQNGRGLTENGGTHADFGRTLPRPRSEQVAPVIAQPRFFSGAHRNVPPTAVTAVLTATTADRSGAQQPGTAAAQDGRFDRRNGACPHLLNACRMCLPKRCSLARRAGLPPGVPGSGRTTQNRRSSRAK